MENLLAGTVEYRNLGWNPATIGFLATIFLTLLQGWSLLKQDATIRRNRSGEPLFASLFIYSVGYCGMLIAYGIIEARIASLFNGLLIVPYLMVALSIRRFSGFSFTDKLGAVFYPLLTPIIAVLNKDGRDWFFIFGAALVVLPIYGQARKMWQSGKSGSVEPRFIISLMVSNFFWAIYGISTDNLPMSILNPLSFLILFCFLILYYAFKRTGIRKEQ